MKINELVDWYSNLTPESVNDITSIYHEWAHFRDPFNDTRGTKEISKIFYHMFKNTEHPRFEIKNVITQENTAWVTWIFHVGIRGKPVSVEGISQLFFSKDGRVISHRDYWDSSELLAQLPVIGTIVRYFKQRLSASGQFSKEETAS